jgi:hypothetical protein
MQGHFSVAGVLDSFFGMALTIWSHDVTQLCLAVVYPVVRVCIHTCSVRGVFIPKRFRNPLCDIIRKVDLLSVVMITTTYTTYPDSWMANAK